jgi:soluble lytic murein transglycosylase-like protein
MLVTAPIFLCSGENCRQTEYVIGEIAIKVSEAHIPMQYYYDVAINAYLNKIPLYIADRLLRAESGYRNIRGFFNNINGSFDAGIAQLNSNSLEMFSHAYNGGEKINPYDTKTSIRVAMAYLGDMIEDTGSIYGGVCAYNCGLSRVQKNAIPERTKKYAKRILG